MLGGIVAEEFHELERGRGEISCPPLNDAHGARGQPIEMDCLQSVLCNLAPGCEFGDDR
jgi:hypothetical protein